MTDIEKQRQELINQCRYFKGEEENPFEAGNESMLWFYECSFVVDSLRKKTNRNNGLAFGLDEYIGCGLKDFRKGDGIPIELKALLFNRYARGCYSMADAVDSFKEFYEEYY